MSEMHESPMLFHDPKHINLSFQNALKKIHTCLSSNILNGLAVSEILVYSEGKAYNNYT